MILLTPLQELFRQASPLIVRSCRCVSVKMACTVMIFLYFFVFCVYMYLLILKQTCFRGEPVPFVMELPGPPLVVKSVGQLDLGKGPCQLFFYNYLCCNCCDLVPTVNVPYCCNHRRTAFQPSGFGLVVLITLISSPSWLWRLAHFHGVQSSLSFCSHNTDRIKVQNYLIAK